MKKQFLEKYGNIGYPVHGGTVHRDGVLDFSISVNPFPLPESVKESCIDALKDIGNYPDTQNASLTAAVSGAMGIEVDTLLMTNGSAEAFSLIASVLLGPEKKAMVLTPGYSDYQHVSRLSGAEVIFHALTEANGFEPDSRLLLNEIEKYKPDVVWLCSPNNPTGVSLKASLIADAVKTADAYGGFVVLDEAYAAFVQARKQPPERLNAGANLIIVRSMTKDFGIPGLRLGYITAEPELIGIFNLCKPCWSVSLPAQYAGIALMKEMVYFRRCWKKTLKLKSAMIDGLCSLGIDPYASSSNDCGIFIFFRAPEMPGAGSFGREMERNGIRLRDCSSMGAGGYYRAGVKQEKDNGRFLSAAAEVMNG